MIRLIAVALAYICLSCGGAAATAPARIALVIGMGTYQQGNGQGWSDIPNAINDARAVAIALRQLGFSVYNPDQPNAPHLDMSREQVGAIIQQFAVASSESDFSLIYYAGHGVQIGGRPYLVPIGAGVSLTPGEAPDLVYLPATALAEAGGGRENRFLILDACRKEMVHDGQPAYAPLGTLDDRDRLRFNVGILYAASPGEPSYPVGRRSNSLTPFTDHLLKRILAPGSSNLAVVNALYDDLRLETENRIPVQQPYLQWSGGRFYFNPPDGVDLRGTLTEINNELAGPSGVTPATLAPLFGVEDADVLIPRALSALTIGDIRRAAQAGDRPSAYLMAIAHNSVLGGVERDPAQFQYYAERAASNGDAYGLHLLGLAALGSGTGQIDLIAAERYLLAAAERGFAKSHYTLGELYFGVYDPAGRSDLAAARRHWTAAAQANSRDGHFRLGEGYLHRRFGFPRDRARGLTHLRTAARLGNGYAGYVLCDYFDRERRYREALAACTDAASRHSRAAMTRLGAAWIQGQRLVGNEPDFVQAHNYLTRAIQPDPSLRHPLDASAYYWLGTMYDQGLGRERDRAEARRLWTIGSAGGNVESQRALREADD